MSDEAAETRPTGRPRDPDLEHRALTAALEVYGRFGWSGFTTGKVAELARVGKSSLYLRWPTKMDLLVAAFDAVQAFHAARQIAGESASFAEAMRAIAHHRLRNNFTPTGLAIARVYVEYQSDPDGMSELWDKSVARGIVSTRHLLRDAIASGELAPDTVLIALADAFEGGLLMHAVSTPANRRQKAIDGIDAFADLFVDHTIGPWLTDKGRQGCDFCG